MAALERGGNAFDAAVAAGLTLQVVEPHLNGPGGDLPAIFFSAREGEPRVLCGAGPGARRGDDRALPPARAVARARDRARRGLRPGRVRRLDAAAARPRHDAARRRARARDRLRRGRLPGGRPDRRDDRMRRARCSSAGRPRPSSTCRGGPGPARCSATPRSRRPTAASSRRRAPATAAPRSTRARDVWYRGFVAEAIDRFQRRARRRRIALRRPRRVLAATFEAPLQRDFRGLTVCKAGPWSQGAGVPAAARAARRLRPRGDGPRLRRLRPHRDRVREARVRRSRGVLRRPALRRRPDATAAVRRVRRRAARLVGERASLRAAPGLGRRTACRGRRRSSRTARPVADRRPGVERPTPRRHGATSTSPTATATWSRRRRAAAGCRARR